MQLLYVIHQYFPDCHSGTEQYCLAASREARRRGDQVVVLSLHWEWGREDPPLLLFEQPYDGFRVIRLNHWWGLNQNDVLRDYLNPAVAAAFRGVLDDVRPDAVHFFHLRQLGVDLLEVAAARGLRTVVNLMDFWYLCPRFTLQRSDGALCEGPPEGGLGCAPCAYPDLAGPLAELAGSAPETRAAARAALARAPLGFSGTPHDRLAALVQRQPRMLAALARADVVVAPSRFLAGMFARNGFTHRHLEVLPYGLEPGRVRRAAVTRPRTPLRVGFAGVLSPWKGPHVVVDAVRQTKVPIQFTVHGRTEEPMFADYIASVRARAGDDPRIRFPGAFGRDTIDQVMADLDVLVVPSLWYENTPFVVLEAQEAGVPVIVSDLGGLAEVVEEGKNGYRFPAGDAAALARLLERCVADPTMLTRLSPQPIGSIAQNYDRFAACYAGAAR
jgi:glycosyltransferase involved in cell wall biosynthesis